MQVKYSEESVNNIDNLLNDKRFLQFLSYGQIAVLYMDKAGKLLYATPYIREITGIQNKDYGRFMGESELSSISPSLVQCLTPLINAIQEAEQSNNHRKIKSIQKHPLHIELIGVDGKTYQTIIHTSLEGDNVVKGIILNFHDITDRKAAESALELEKVKYKLIAELTDCALWEYDIDKKELNQYQKFHGRYSNENLIIKDYRNFILGKGWIHPEDVSAFHEYCDAMDRGDTYIQQELRALGDNHEYIWIRYQGTCLKDSTGKAHLIVGRTLNIDKDRREYEKLLQKSQRDPLTGLYNRNTTKEKIETCFAYSKSKNDNAVHNFMIIDIDNFKMANDVWGHLFGDILLENFARKLEEILDSTDIPGRIGGDEFVILKQGIMDAENISTTAKLICDMSRRYLKGLHADDAITVSIGIATYPKDGTDYDTLYKKADMALYYAKSKGKDQYAFYGPEAKRYDRSSQKANDHWIKANLIDQTNPEIEKRLLNYAVDILNRSTDSRVAVNKILQEIGKYYDLSRIVIIEKQLRGTKAYISYEWRNTNIPSINTSEFDIPAMGRNDFDKLFHDYGVYYVNDINCMDPSSEMKSFYEHNDIKSLVQCAINYDDQHVGTISFEDCTAERNWTKHELDSLYTMTKLISTFIIQLNNQSLLDNEIFFTQATLNNQKLCNYAVKQDTYQIEYFSDYTKKQYPDVELGNLCYKAIYGKEEPCEPCPRNGLCSGAKSYSMEAYNAEKDYWYSTTASRIISPDGVAIHMINTSDVTSFINRVNSIDPMTGLLTLSRFEAEGMRLIVENEQTKYLVMYCDFDRFKNINDEWGYSVGNDILIHFAKLAGNAIHSDELFCRITADIFVMLLAYQSYDQAIERIHHCHSAITKNLKEDFPEINIVLISGIYLLAKEDYSLSLAIDRANIARKTVKGLHKSSYAIYDKSLHEKVMKENRIENNMHNALMNKEFVVYYQPKMDLKTMKINGAEALVRWKLPDGKLMGPDEFIPIFEKNGFIVDLDFYVYEATLQAMRSWIDSGKKPIIISMNVSRIHLDDSRFIDRLQQLLTSYDISPNLIELEITESMFINNLDRLRFFVNNLRKHGFIISIDDFGSGFSSLNLLKSLPIDILKLDREFFMHNTMEKQDKLVISGIISLAKGLGLKVLSEGIETVEQLEFIRENLCDMAQGYLFYHPMPMEEFIQLLD
ncbi:MAG: diguanylate cyclase/phosphodiesterase [Firmicutes bacterium]|nr:diguanylate cyclase/phosphodiesterase [Bacillota bacterium]